MFSKIATCAALASTANAYLWIETFDDGPKFRISWDYDREMIKFEAEVPHNMKLGLGFGLGMTNVDMAFFQSIEGGEVIDLWSPGYVNPIVDTTQDFKDIRIAKKDKEGRVLKFEAYRDLKTGDHTQDAAFECGRVYDWTWVVNEDASKLFMHNHDGVFLIQFGDDCFIETSAIAKQGHTHSHDNKVNMLQSGSSALGASLIALGAATVGMTLF